MEAFLCQVKVTLPSFTEFFFVQPSFSETFKVYRVTVLLYCQVKELRLMAWVSIQERPSSFT